jgi:hypothetical protein
MFKYSHCYNFSASNIFRGNFWWAGSHSLTRSQHISSFSTNVEYLDSSYTAATYITSTYTLFTVINDKYAWIDAEQLFVL